MVETRSMKRKRQMLLMQSYIRPRTDLPATFESLNNDTLTTALEFVGNKSYATCAGINKHCREVYLNTKGMTKQTFLYGYARLSVIIDRIIKQEDHLLEMDLKIYEGVAIGVVFYNRSDVLVWLLEQRKNGVLRGICEVAAMEGRFDILDEVSNNVKNEDDKRDIFEDFGQYAARHGTLEILKGFDTIGLYFCMYDCALQAAKHGHLHIIKWLQEEKGLSLIGGLYFYAADGGQLHVMKWLREKEADWGKWTFTSAALEGNLEVLQWLHDEGCPWPEDDDYRVHYVRPGVLEWLRVNGYGDRISRFILWEVDGIQVI